MSRRSTNNRKLFQPRAGLALLPLLPLVLSSCATHKADRDGYPSRPVDVSRVGDAVPKVEPKSRYGNPTSYVVFGKRYHTLSSSQGFVEEGIASWYGTKFHGRRTSSGEPYDMYKMTAAHKSLPLPTYARVTNLRNGRSVVVKVNDRGPFHDNRVIDLSYSAASKLGILARGTGIVRVEAIDPRAPAPSAPAVTTRTAGAAVTPAASAAASAVPVIDAAVAQKMTSLPKPAAGNTDPRMFLQVGAFSSRDNADRLRARLAGGELDRPVRVTEFTTANGPMFRVQVGPLASADDVDQTSSALQAQGIDAPRVVID